MGCEMGRFKQKSLSDTDVARRTMDKKSYVLKAMPNRREGLKQYL